MKYFGTDGIRGSFGDAKINAEFFAKLGAAASAYALENGANRKFVIARDTRESGVELCKAFCGAARGVEIFDMGVASTPLLAYATKLMGADFGVMITASHNPYTDNGIKFFNADAQKISDDAQLALEALVDSPKDISAHPAAKISEERGAREKYFAHMLSILPEGCLSGMKVALDSANGATVGITSEVLKRYGAELFEIGNAPDGKNINRQIGSEHTEALARLCAESGADIGFAHDGDGDRLVVFDETASALSGEEVLGLIAFAGDDEGSLKGGAIVTTLQSNLGLDEALAKRSIKTLRSGIGDRLVMQMMLENSCNIGGENSGHYIFSDVSPCGDGLAAALKLLSIVVKSKSKLSALRGGIRLYPVSQGAIKVSRKTPVDETKNLSAAVAECERLLAGAGRLLVRYSGTENKIRLLVESPDEALNARCFEALKKAVELDLQ